MTEARDEIGLDEALEGLRAELASAQAKAAEKDVQFPVETLTVELKVGATKTAEGKAGFCIPLIGAELGGGAAYAGESVQTVTIVFGSPVDRDGQPVKVARATDTRKA